METQAQWIDLRPFCDKENSRYQLDAPFVQSGEWCATNGRILACVPAPGLPDTVPTGKGWSGQPLRLPRVAELIDPIVKVKEWQPLPPMVTDCEKCKGSGKASSLCVCDDCGHRHSHEYNCDCSVQLGNRRVAVAYAAEIYKLPGVTWGVVDEDDPLAQIYFRFAGGGRGIVMPLDPEKEDAT